MTESKSQLSARQAFLCGVVCLAIGALPLLDTFGIVDMHRTPDTPAWIGPVIAAMFILAAIALFGDAAAGGTMPDGSLPPSAGALSHRLQSAVALGIVVLMGVVGSWIAFGPGERHFSSTIAIPFLAYHSRGGDLAGRIAFGVGAILIWGILLAVLVSRLRRMTRRR